MKRLSKACSARNWLIFMLQSALIFSCIDSSADAPTRDERLTVLVRTGFMKQWESALEPSRSDNSVDKASPQLEGSTISNLIDAAARTTVICFRSKATRFNTEDVDAFEELLLEYPDPFQIQDWRKRSDRAMDERFGQGASQIDYQCSKTDDESRECKIVTSRLAGFWLTWEFSQCATQSAKSLAESLSGATSPSNKRNRGQEKSKSAVGWGE